MQASWNAAFRNGMASPNARPLTLGPLKIDDKLGRVQKRYICDKAVKPWSEFGYARIPSDNSPAKPNSKCKVAVPLMSSDLATKLTKQDRMIVSSPNSPKMMNLLLNISNQNHGKITTIWGLASAKSLGTTSKSSTVPSGTETPHVTAKISRLEITAQNINVSIQNAILPCAINTKPLVMNTKSFRTKASKNHPTKKKGEQLK